MHSIKYFEDFIAFYILPELEYQTNALLEQGSQELLDLRMEAEVPGLFQWEEMLVQE